MSVDTVEAKEGKKCLKIEVTATANDPEGCNWHVQLQDPTWPAKKGVQYTYSCYAKAETDTASRRIHIAAQGDSTSEYTYRAGTNFTLSTEWQRCEYSFISDVEGIGKMNFFVYCGFSTGIFYFDSMALDSMTPSQVRNPMMLSTIVHAPDYNVRLLPECIRVVCGNSPEVLNKVAIYSLEGRLISSQNIPSTTKVFEMQKPAPGAWVIGVNSDKKVLRIPR